VPADTTLLLRLEPAESPGARRGSKERSETPAARQPAEPPRPSRRQWRRWALFLLLPLVLIAGGYWYVTGGQVMATDDAYVEADKVGISTDVSGIVKEIEVTENQRIEAGQILFRLDDLPFELALKRAEAQVDIVRNDLNALKANYRDLQAQIKQAHDATGYHTHEF